MNHSSLKELRAQVLEALLGADATSEESYVDTKAKFIIDDMVALIEDKQREARIDEVNRTREAWHGTDDKEFAYLMNERLEQLNPSLDREELKNE